tara:strand:+ start:22 stop:576 length:555 start_codon:yes stop_codon:yes gene_type:complete
MKKIIGTILVTVIVLAVLNHFQDRYRKNVMNIKFLEQGIKTQEIHKNSIDSINNIKDSLEIVNDSLNSLILELKPKKIRVTATMYHPVLGQCDATPDITADQSKIPNIDSCSHLNWIAVSQDLLWFNGGPFHYGDRVVVTNAGHKDGVYTIRDAMNKRFTYKIDFLESVNTRGYRFDDVIMAKL